MYQTRDRLSIGTSRHDSQTMNMYNRHCIFRLQVSKHDQNAMKKLHRSKDQDLPNGAMIKQVITSDLAGEHTESAESDVGGPHLVVRSRFDKRLPTPTPSRATNRPGAQILLVLVLHANQQRPPKTELGVALDRQLGPLTGPANMSFDPPNRDRSSGFSQVLSITPSTAR